MKADDVLKNLTDENIIDIMKELGSDEYRYGKGCIIFRSVCHGSDSFKLYWYREAKRFHCYSCCGNMSLWEMVCFAQGWNIETDFGKAMSFVCRIANIKINRKKTRTDRSRDLTTEDMNILSRHLVKRNKRDMIMEVYDYSVMNRFEEAYPIQWKQEGIDGVTAEKFDIRLDSTENQAIIPHRAENGDLIGIRVRNFNPEVVERGAKYTPLFLGGKWYRFPTGSTFYGLYENGQDIENSKTVFLVEAEKSCMQLDSMYDGHGLGLATMGTNFSNTQRDILIEKGVRRVYICFDREYCDEWYKEEYDNTQEQRLMFGYFKKILKIYRMLNNYMEVNVVLDWEGILPMKASPTDCGREVFEKLIREQCVTICNEQELLELCGME